jgi:hypothetical protein
MVQQPIYPSFEVRFDQNHTFAEVGSVIIADNSFQTGTNTTALSWVNVGSANIVSQNFYEMLVANSEFFEATLTRTYDAVASQYVVQVVYFAAKKFNWIAANFDTTGMTGINATYTDGLPKKENDLWLWYQVFSDGKKVSEKRTVPFIHSYVELELRNLVRPLAKSTMPQLSPAFNIYVDSNILASFFLRAGAIQLENCTKTYKSALISPTFEVVDSIFQLHETKEFRECAPLFGTLAKFLTQQGDIQVCKNMYAWLWCYVNEPDLAVRVKATKSDATTTEYTYNMPIGSEGKVVTISTGTAQIGSIMSLTDVIFYEVTVIRIGALFNGLPYSETKKYHCAGCTDELEIYWKEERGSFVTTRFRAFDDIELISESYETNTRILTDPSAFTHFYRDGREKHTHTKALRYHIESEGFGKEQYNFYRQFYQSDQHYVRWQLKDGSDILRKIVIEKENDAIIKPHENPKLTAMFRFHGDLI